MDLGNGLLEAFDRIGEPGNKLLKVSDWWTLETEESLEATNARENRAKLQINGKCIERRMVRAIPSVADDVVGAAQSVQIVKSL